MQLLEIKHGAFAQICFSFTECQCILYSLLTEIFKLWDSLQYVDH
jgi:hypothetical protein